MKMSLRKWIAGVCVAAFVCASATLRAADYDVRDFGARGDGKTLNTKAIQAAVDKCTQTGGRVVFPAGGAYVSGTIYLKNNVMLYVERGDRKSVV